MTPVVGRQTLEAESGGALVAPFFPAFSPRCSSKAKGSNHNMGSAFGFFRAPVPSRCELTAWGPIGLNYYDANGNLTNKAYDTAGDATIFTYDDENRLVDAYNL